MRSDDVTLFVVGALLLASGFRKAERTAVAHRRADLNLRLQRLRRRGSNASSFVGVLLGAGIVGYVSLRVARDLAHEAKEAIQAVVPDLEPATAPPPAA